jgi:diacylglycerol O-acyltransferase / wax synthase
MGMAWKPPVPERPSALSQGSHPCHRVAMGSIGTPEPRTYLSQNDAIMWTVESDPLLRSTIVGVVVLDGPPDWDRLVARVEHVVQMVPELRERVVPVPLHPTTWRWEPDPEFDIEYHLRRVEAPSPHTMREVLDLARTNALAGFDRTRPLWEFTLVEGLADGGAALVMKAHHVVTDGIGAVQLAVHLFDLEPAPTERRTTTPVEQPAGAPEVRGVTGLVREVVAHDLDGVIGFVRSAVPSVVPSLLRAIRDPFHAVAETVRTVQSIGRTVAPVTHTLSPVMVDRHRHSTFETLEVPFDALRSAAARVGGTLNDGFLAAISGGLRRYHDALDVEVEDLRVAMPVSLRASTDDPGGNHVTVMRFTVPAGVVDAPERVRRLHDIGRRIRGEQSLAHTEAIAGVLNLMPRGVIGSMLKHIDFLASNVPGVPVPLFLEGRRVLRYIPFGPTAGSSMNVTLMTYDGICCIGVNIDTAAVTDVPLFMQCLRDGFDEVLAIGE